MKLLCKIFFEKLKFYTKITSLKKRWTKIGIGLQKVKNKMPANMQYLTSY